MTFGYVPDTSRIDYGAVLAMLERSTRLAKDRADGMDEVIAQIADGRAQLWVETDPLAALVSRKYGTILEIWHCAGAVLHAADRHLATIEEAARESGVEEMRLTGRQGWQRHLRKWGWVRDGDILMKEIG